MEGVEAMEGSHTLLHAEPDLATDRGGPVDVNAENVAALEIGQRQQQIDA